MTFFEAYLEMKAAGKVVFRYTSGKDQGYKTHLQIAVGRICRGIQKSTGLFWQPATLTLSDLDATDWEVVDAEEKD